ncbi:S-adenosylmethionine-dependent methyltransferase [Martiniozyma asiatica (nom. inval.)]|nr:S-adenosylmethionine-dependent methyltransferase [Martiniozyma asiatica]
MSDDEVSFNGDFFEEPEEFQSKREENNFVKYKRNYATINNKHNISEINLRLVGKSPLWGHLLWNAGIYTANFIEKNPDFVKDKTVVEFGSAAALPSLLCGLNGAKKVLSTDYPDGPLLENIQFNIDSIPWQQEKEKVKVCGHIWGQDTQDLKEELGDWADVLIMSDLVFNHSEHHKLLKSAKEMIRPLRSGKRTGGQCLVVFSPHRPWLLDNDLQFFKDAAEEFGFDVELKELVHWDHPMFEEDSGDLEIRKRVYCHVLHPTW